MRNCIGKFKESNVYYDSGNSMNGHEAEIGKSGSGKSTQSVRMCINHAKNGETVIAFDMHNTLAPTEIHPKLMDDFEALSNTIDVYEDGIKCPLLKPIMFSDGKYEEDIDTIGATVDIFGRTYNLQCRQRATLRRAVSTVFNTDAYDEVGCKAIGDQLQIMASEVAANVYEKMMMLFEHNVFRPGDFNAIPGKINIIRLSKFDLDTQAVISEVLLSYLWRMAAVGTYKDKPIYVFVDECQNLNLGKEHALTKLLTEGRKFGVNLNLATQYLVNSTAEAQRILQAGLIMYFKPTQNKIRETASIIDSTRVDDWVAVLSSLKQGEFVAVGPVEVGGKISKVPLKINGWID